MTRILISGDARNDPRYEELAADWRDRGFDANLVDAGLDKTSEGNEAIHDVLIWLSDNVAQDVLAVLVADVTRCLRRRSPANKSRKKRTLFVEIYTGVDETLRYFEVDEDAGSDVERE